MPIINFIILNQVQNIIYLFIIITSIWYFRAIITAAHCVCSESTENKERYLKCIPNSDKKNPSNQIISGRDIFYVVGQQIVDREIDNRWNSFVAYLFKIIILWLQWTSRFAFGAKHKNLSSLHCKGLPMSVYGISRWKNEWEWKYLM